MNKMKCFFLITVLFTLCTFSTAENTMYDYDEDDNYYDDSKSDDSQYETETERTENQYETESNVDGDSKTQYETGTDHGGSDDNQYDDEDRSDDDEDRSDDDNQYEIESKDESTHDQYEIESKDESSHNQYEVVTEPKDESNDNQYKTGGSDEGEDYNYEDYEDNSNWAADQQSETLAHHQQEPVEVEESQPAETQQPPIAESLTGINHHHATTEKALLSYMEITKSELDAPSILSLYKEGDKETHKFIKNVFKALEAINKVKEKQYHGFDWPEDVISLLKKYHPNKSNAYIARFLCHYYKGYSGARKQYLRMKVRLLSSELQHERKRRSHHVVNKKRKHSHRMHRKRPMKIIHHHTVANGDSTQMKHANDHDTTTSETKVEQDNLNSCDSCGMKDNEEVCGSDGRTYNSLCHAVNCGGLEYTDVRLGKCEERNPCDTNTCKSHQMCIPKINPTCFSLYDKEGKKVPCPQYKCISKRHCEKPKHLRHVCSNNGNTYTSLCFLYQSSTTLAYHGTCNTDKCSKEVCGSNGVTYATNCHAKERGVRIDYTGKCLFTESWSKKEACANVRRSERCAKIPPLCKKWIIPKGSCCPVCGVAVSTHPDSKALAKMGKANKLQFIQKLITHQLIPHESRDKCHISITYSDNKLLTIVLEPFDNEGEPICESAAMKLADKINNPTSHDRHIIIRKLGPAEYHSPSNENIHDIMNSH